MPSYRLRIQIGAMRAGAHPQDVLPKAVDVASKTAFVEARDLDIDRGLAWIQLRILVDESSVEDDQARLTLIRVQDEVNKLAHTGQALLLKQLPKGKWIPLGI